MSIINAHIDRFLSHHRKVNPPLKAVRRFEGAKGCVVAGGCFEVPAFAGMTELSLITEKLKYYGR